MQMWAKLGGRGPEPDGGGTKVPKISARKLAESNFNPRMSKDKVIYAYTHIKGG